MKVRQDPAGKLKAAIEKDRNGKSTGWQVFLESRNQSTLYTWDEYDFMSELFSDIIFIYRTSRSICTMLKPLKCSWKLAPYKKNRRIQRQKRISKDKSSERLPANRLPLESTQPLRFI